MESLTSVRLRAEMRLPVVACLTWTVEPANVGSTIVQTGAFDPEGFWSGSTGSRSCLCTSSYSQRCQGTLLQSLKRGTDQRCHGAPEDLGDVVATKLPHVEAVTNRSRYLYA